MKTAAVAVLHWLFYVTGQDPHDATSSAKAVPDYAAALQPLHTLSSKPLEGKRIGVIAEMMQGGPAPGVATAVLNSIKHLESLGADTAEVRKACFALPAVDSPELSLHASVCKMLSQHQ